MRSLSSTRTVLAATAAGLSIALCLTSCGGPSTSTPTTAAPTPTAAAAPTTPADDEATDLYPSTEVPSPQINQTAADAALVGAGSLAVDVLNELPVKGRAPKTGYSRDQFGQAWADTDRNGCDTRNDILRRDLTGIVYKPGSHNCAVASGTLNDPYTGTTISFVRGKATSSAVQIDHVVALSDAWQKGALQLSADTRREFANDPYNLLAVDGPANQQKSDGDAATWLPANKSYRCTYVARQIGVKKKYQLWVTQAEKDAMLRVLGDCPGQTVPENTGNAVAAPVQPAAAAPVVAPAPAPAPEPEPAPAPAPAPAPVPESSGAYYKNCSQARAAGAAPIYRGQPGYRSELDRDNDGVACE